MYVIKACNVPTGCIRLQCVAALQAGMQPVDELWVCRESVASVQLPATLQSTPLLLSFADISLTYFKKQVLPLLLLLHIINVPLLQPFH